MAFEIVMTADAEAQWLALSVRVQRVLEAAVKTRLRHQPVTLSKAIKRLRQNPFAQFELRAGDFRVLYNVTAATVVIVAVGHKVGNKLIVSGEEFHGHQNDSSESSGERS